MNGGIRRMGVILSESQLQKVDGAHLDLCLLRDTRPTNTELAEA